MPVSDDAAEMAALPPTYTEDSEVEHKTQPVRHVLTTSKYTREVRIAGWAIHTSKLPISNAKEIDALSTSLDLPLPEMIFGHNAVRLTHLASGTRVAWNTHDALDLVDKTGTKLQVAYAADWHSTRDEVSDAIKHVTRPYDWTYSTDYACSTTQPFAETSTRLPLALLQREDPILFYDEVILYESELDDNGTSMLSVKVRVMPERAFVLSRFFMRLDNVIFRVRDTRVIVEFSTGQVLREYTVREEQYAIVKSKIKPYQVDELGTLLSDANWVSQHCPIIDGRMEAMTIA